MISGRRSANSATSALAIMVGAMSIGVCIIIAAAVH